jgi:hypothetical protein
VSSSKTAPEEALPLVPEPSSASRAGEKPPPERAHHGLRHEVPAEKRDEAWRRSRELPPELTDRSRPSEAQTRRPKPRMNRTDPQSGPSVSQGSDRSPRPRGQAPERTPEGKSTEERAETKPPTEGGAPIDREASLSLDPDRLVENPSRLLADPSTCAEGIADLREKLLCLLIEPTCLASL